MLRQTPGRAGVLVRVPTIAYIDAFRGIPLLMVDPADLRRLRRALVRATRRPGPIPESLAVPTWFGKPSAFWYGAMALVITYGAYMAEVYRAGIEAVPEGQIEAARSLGMSHGQTMRFVIVPQAIRKVIPPLLNDLIALMKDTSLVSFISLSEVVLVGFDLQSKTFNSSGADARGDLVPDRHHPAGPRRRLADRPRPAQDARAAAGRRTPPRPVAAGTGLAGADVSEPRRPRSRDQAADRRPGA